MRRVLMHIAAIITVVVSGQSPASAQQDKCARGGCVPGTSGLRSAALSQSAEGDGLAAAASNSLNFFRNYFVTGDYAVAGVGVRGSGTGTVNMTAVPAGAEVVAAYLYWQTLGDGQSATFRGLSITGTPLGTTISPCWVPPSITTYRADVLGRLPRDAQGRVIANGSHTVQFPDSGDWDAEPSTEGASLVIVYTSPALPYKAVVIYDGTFTAAPTVNDGLNLVIRNFGQPSGSPPQARITHIVGDGQAAGDQAFMDTLSVNGTVLGNSRQAFTGAQGAMWDNLTSNVTALVPSNASSLRTTVAWPSDATGNRDCLTWGAIVFSTTNPPLPALSLSQVFDNSVTAQVSSTTGPDIMTATFTPNRGGLSLGQAASLAGYDHLNWLNIVTKDTALSFPLLRNLAGLTDHNGTLPVPPYFDPVFGGYQYQAANCGVQLPVKDRLPWYLDEEYSFNCKQRSASPIVLSEREGLYSPTSTSLSFEDIPGSFANVEFLTALVGVRSDGSGDILNFPSTIFRWEYDGSLDELLYFPDLRLKTFTDLTAAEVSLLESSPVIRGNTNPAIVQRTGTIKVSATVPEIPVDALQVLARQGIGIRHHSGIVTPVEIDIKPGEFPNSVNPRAKGAIPVAILTTPHFTASTVSASSVRFGPSTAPEIHGRGHIEDVDGDGDLDMVLHFDTAAAGIACGNSTAGLSAQTVDGRLVQGSNTIKAVGCK